MGIFSSIVGKIFPKAQAATISDNLTRTNVSAMDTQSAASIMAPVDVEVILNGLLKASRQTLNWKTSIVDLLKLVGLDSSLEARKTLAAELNYSGDTSDSATMNLWLHKAVMKKIAENGGTLPADIQL